jgi:transcription antitermination factor NusG
VAVLTRQTLADSGATSVGEVAWYAVHTKRCQEEGAAENLKSAGIETFFAPLAFRSGKRSSLFPGYIFARFDCRRHLRLVQYTRGILSVVSFSGIPAVIECRIIDAIRDRCSDGTSCLAQPLCPGRAVIVSKGPLRNIIGIFDRELPGTERVHILLSNIAFSARLEIAFDEIQPID